MAILSGYFAKKIMVDSKSSILMRIVKTIAQFGITNFITNNADEIRLYISNLISKFITPKEEIAEREL
jgi:hypothetical protein